MCMLYINKHIHVQLAYIYVFNSLKTFDVKKTIMVDHILCEAYLHNNIHIM